MGKETSKRFMTKHEGKEYMVLTTKHKRGPEFTQVWAKKGLVSAGNKAHPGVSRPMRTDFASWQCRCECTCWYLPNVFSSSPFVFHTSHVHYGRLVSQHMR